MVVGHHRRRGQLLGEPHRKARVRRQQGPLGDRRGGAEVGRLDAADYCVCVSAERDSGVADKLRSAIEHTMRATAGSAASSRERAGELVDEVVRRGLGARDELARRGQEAGVELARRGQEATGEVSKRIEMLEARLAELEQRLQVDSTSEPKRQSKPKPEG
jgi:polyhydroxyalkanoate synthesis regulator phasin